MCSIFNDFDNNNINSEENGFTGQKELELCKCGCKEIVLTLTLYGSFCKECFLQRVAHKFRSEFGKSRLVRDNEDVAVAFSGGKKSMAMVNLIKEGRSKRAQKKLRFNPILIHIIEPKQWESSFEFDYETIKTLYSLEIPFYIFSFSQAFDDDLLPLLSEKDDLGNFNKEEFCKKIDLSKFYDFKKSLKQPTSIESMLYLMRKQLLMRICKELHLSKVLMGDTAGQLAIRLISFVSQGRGGQLSYEMEFADDRNVDVTFVKPMRAFLDEEIDALLDLKELKFSKKTEKWEVQTIESLTEEFIKKLQTENDKTLSILCRTGEKLTVAKEGSGLDVGEGTCCLCKALIDRNASKVTANSAVTVSLSISDKLKADANRRGDESVDTNTINGLVHNMSLKSSNCCQGSNSNINKLKSGNDFCNKGSCCNSANNVPLLSRSDIIDFLCYGCQILVKDMRDVSKLPPNFLEEIQMKIRRKNMKESIENFILVDGEDSQTE